MNRLKIHHLSDFDLKDKNVFMRVDFNVPLQGQKIIDSYRIKKTMPSIRFVLNQGGHLLLASHLGRPGGCEVPSLSLKPVAKYLSEQEQLEVLFIEEPDSPLPKKLLPGLKNNQVMLLENLRFHPGEEAQDLNFAKLMASYTDIYINEGFGISHRQHTSLSLLPQLIPQKALGYQMDKEIKQLDKLFNCEKPFFVFLGGSKLKDKIPLMEALINLADEFFIGGLMAYTFLKAKNQSVGLSPVESDLLPLVSGFIKRLKESGKQLWLPTDHIIEQEGEIKVCNHLPPKALGRDIGPQTAIVFSEKLKQAKTVFLNGPMGFFEKPEFRSGSQSLAQALAQHKEAYRVVGGGHSALAFREFEQDLDHVSTGGGACLSYLQGEDLPGLKSLITKTTV